MANASVPGLASIQDPIIRRALQYLEDVSNNLGTQTNAAPVGSTPAPPTHAGVVVTGGGGKLGIKISDPYPANRGVERFADVSEDPSFATFHTIHIGASHNHYGDSPVDGMANVRTYSQYPTGARSDFLYHPTAVDTSAATAANKLSGNAVSGYGSTFNNSVTQPKRA